VKKAKLELETTSGENVRLFIGTFLEPPERAAIERFQIGNANRQLNQSATINWTLPTKLHITWCFLGDVDEKNIAAVKNGIESALEEIKALRSQESTCPLITFSRIAFWPKSKNPNVIVLRPDKTEAEKATYFVELARLLRAKTANFVTNLSDQKEFRAHLTLGRVRRESLSDENYSEISTLSHLKFQELEQLLPVKVQIKRIELIESSQKILGGYRSLECFELGFKENSPEQFY